jgi:Raf kinase inhibitor-like YbhB/YbcL family protein
MDRWARAFMPVVLFVCMAAVPRAAEAQMTLSSSAFGSGEIIPNRYAKFGGFCQFPGAQNISPDLTFSGQGAGQSIALLVVDPDGGDFIHWVLWNWPPSQTAISEGQPQQAQLPNGARQGKNDFALFDEPGIGYDGPCPPSDDEPHRYRFQIYSLDGMLDLPPETTGNELIAAMKGRIVAQGQLEGLFDPRTTAPTPTPTPTGAVPTPTPTPTPTGPALATPTPTPTSGAVATPTSTPTPAAPVDRVRNGGFEDGADHWNWQDDDSTSIVTGSAHTGERMARMGDPLGLTNDWLWQDVAIPSELAGITLEFWYRFTLSVMGEGSSSSRLWVIICDPEGATDTIPCPTWYVVPVADRLFVESGPWTKETYVLSDPDVSGLRGRTVRLAFQLTSVSDDTSTLDIDDVMLLTTAADPVPAGGVAVGLLVLATIVILERRLSARGRGPRRASPARKKGGA